MKEGDELVLLRIAQPKHAHRHVEIVFDLGLGPAGHLLNRPCWAVAGSDIEGVDIARVVEMHQLFQALDVAVVEKLLLEVGPWGFGGRTL